jgi:hypothetical protein
MIHSVSVPAGDSDCAKAAQMHALRVAQWFHARLTVAITRAPSETQGSVAGDQSMESCGERVVAKLTEESGNAHTVVESSIRGEGLLKGLLAEARESDLLVVGLPAETTDGADPLVQAVRHHELPLLHKAECLVLVVSRPPQPVWRILVDYQGGTVGKGALRAAGEIAVRTSAAVTVLCVAGDIGVAGSLASSAERYLAGFGLSSVAVVTRVGQSGSITEIDRTARSVEAGLLVIGGEQPSLLNWLTDRTSPDPEGVAALTHIAVLVAR